MAAVMSPLWLRMALCFLDPIWKMKNKESTEKKCFCRFLHTSIVIQLAVFILLNVRDVDLSFKADIRKLIWSFMLLILSWEHFSEIFWQLSWFCFPSYRTWDVKDLEAFMVVYYVSCRYTVVYVSSHHFQSSSSVLRFINAVIAICYLIFTTFP